MGQIRLICYILAVHHEFSTNWVDLLSNICKRTKAFCWMSSQLCTGLTFAGDRTSLACNNIIIVIIDRVALAKQGDNNLIRLLKLAKKKERKKNHICFENTPRRSPTIHIQCRIYQPATGITTFSNPVFLVFLPVVLLSFLFGKSIDNTCNSSQKSMEHTIEHFFDLVTLTFDL